MMTNKIAPSMMCADLLEVGKQLQVLEEEAVDLLHIDVMDGSFVPNIALGTGFISQVKRACRIPLDIHLMVEHPENYLPMLPISEGDYVSVHFESTRHLQRLLRQIKDRGAKTLLAINPATPVELAVDILDDVDGILIMTVNPGFAGQKMVEHSIEKIKRTRAFLDSHGRYDAQIEVDGNVSIENAKRMKDAGANIFVLGTAVQSGTGFLGDDIARFKQSVFEENKASD